MQGSQRQHSNLVLNLGSLIMSARLVLSEPLYACFTLMTAKLGFIASSQFRAIKPHSPPDYSRVSSVNKDASSQTITANLRYLRDRSPGTRSMSIPHFLVWIRSPINAIVHRVKDVDAKALSQVQITAKTMPF